MQDKWGVLCHSRPSLIPDRITREGENDSDWDVRPCTVDDFYEISIKAEDASYGSIDAQIGRVSFLHAIELTRIFSQLQYAFCSVGATKKGGRLDRLGATETMTLAEPFAQQIWQWYINLPGCLKLDTAAHVRSLSANGALHLSHMAAELTLHRAVLRALRPDTPPSLRSTIRTAACARLLSALKLVEMLQPKHTPSFWGFAPPAQMAMIGSFAGLLWATSAGCDEAIDYADQIE